MKSSRESLKVLSELRSTIQKVGINLIPSDSWFEMVAQGIHLIPVDQGLGKVQRPESPVRAKGAEWETWRL